MLPDTLWFESAPGRTAERNKLNVPALNGRPKALSDQKLNLADDETFVFSLDYIEQLKEEFRSGNGGETEQGVVRLTLQSRTKNNFNRRSLNQMNWETHRICWKRMFGN